MASTLYGRAKDHFLRGEINWTTGAFAVALITSADYTPDFFNDDVLSVIPTAAIVAESPNLTTLTTSGQGVALADNVTILNVTGGEVDALVIYENTGDPTTSKLIAYIDSPVIGLPLTPNGGQIEIAWDTGVNGIFTL